MGLAAVLALVLPLAAQARLTKQDAGRFQSKLVRITGFANQPQARASVDGAAVAAASQTTQLTDTEVNAYLQFHLKDQVPAGVVDPSLSALGEGRVRGGAVIDLDAVRKQKQRAWTDPMSYMTGKLPLTASGLLITQNGVGRFQLDPFDLPLQLPDLADQFRRPPSPDSAEAAQDGVYGTSACLDAYGGQALDGLYQSEQAILERGHLRAGQDLLDVGCGLGREAQGFRARGLRVTAVDASRTMIERARKLWPDSGVRFQVGGFTRLDFPPASFDAAYVSSDVYQRTPGWSHRVAALARLRPLLRPGGRVVFPVSLKPPGSLKTRILVEAPLALPRRARPERTLEAGDRFFRSGPGAPPLLTHLFRDAGEVAAEVADAGLLLVDRLVHDPRGGARARAAPLRGPPTARRPRPARRAPSRRPAAFPAAPFAGTHGRAGNIP